MKRFIRLFLLVFCAVPGMAFGQVATTAGSNLTAWNGNTGATNNNNWNQMMNPRAGAGGGASAPAADFGNCNALILRCAQPKCSGCTTMEVARPIVAGCVNANTTCKKHGDALIDYITAQMVSTANAKVQEAQVQAQQAAAQAAAAESSAQMQQMQQQMAQMQQQMAQQSQQQMEQMQAALEQQKAMTEAALAEAAAAKQESGSGAGASSDASSGTSSDESGSGSPMTSDGSVRGGLTAAQQKAAEAGVDADILVREQISGQILTKIEEAEISLKELEKSMQATFTYAGCDSYGNNCAGPKRVKKFKEMAQSYFRPYDEVVDNAYEGLEMALAVGVDVSDVVMMLSGACNRWAKYLCVGMDEKDKDGNIFRNQAFYCDGSSAGQKGWCTTNGINCRNGKSIKAGYVRGGFECTNGMVVPPQDDVRCTPTEFIGGAGDENKVLREWVNENDEDSGLVRVGCATSVLDGLAIFGRRSSRRDTGATLDLDTLERIIMQDAPDAVGSNRFMRNTGEDAKISRIKYCSMTPNGYEKLRAAVLNKKLPKNICVTMDSLSRTALVGGGLASSFFAGFAVSSGIVPGANKEFCDYLMNPQKTPAYCGVGWDATNGRCVYNDVECKLVYEADGDLEGVVALTTEDKMKRGCTDPYSGGTWDENGKSCKCPDGRTQDKDTFECVHPGFVSTSECRNLCSGMGAGIGKITEGGKKCMCGQQLLFDMDYCDARNCSNFGGRVRRFEDVFFETADDFKKGKSVDVAPIHESCCVCEATKAFEDGKGKSVLLRRPFSPKKDHNKCNKSAKDWGELFETRGTEQSPASSTAGTGGA